MIFVLTLERSILQTNGLRAISPLAMSISSRRLEGIEIGTETFRSLVGLEMVLDILGVNIFLIILSDKLDIENNVLGFM
jgi:hypothetical protein